MRSTAAAALLAAAAAYSSGYTASCVNMPGHGSTGTPSGYTVTLRDSIGAAATSWAPGQTYTIEVARSGGTFRGFAMAVFTGGSTPGSFSNAKAGALGSSSAAQAMTGCAGGATHRDGTDKSSVVVPWTPPAAGTGAVSFYGMFVIARLGANHYITQSWPEAVSPSGSPAAAAVSPSGSGTPPAASPSGSGTPPAASPSGSGTPPAASPSSSGTPPAASPSGSGTPTPLAPTPSPSAAATGSSSVTVTATGSGTASPTSSGSPPSTPTVTMSAGASPSGTASPTPSGVTASGSPAASPSSSGSGAASGAPTPTPTPTVTPTPSPTASPTASRSAAAVGGSGSPSPTGSPPAAGGVSPSPTGTGTAGSGGGSPTTTPTAAVSGGRTGTPTATLASPGGASSLSSTASTTATGTRSAAATPTPSGGSGGGGDAWGPVGTAVATGDARLPLRVTLVDNAATPPNAPLRARLWFGTRTPAPNSSSAGFADFKLEASGRRWVALARADTLTMLAPGSGFAVVGRADTGAVGVFALTDYSTSGVSPVAGVALGALFSAPGAPGGPTITYNATADVTTAAWSRPLEALGAGDKPVPAGAPAGFIWALGAPGGAWGMHDAFGLVSVTLPSVPGGSGGGGGDGVGGCSRGGTCSGHGSCVNGTSGAPRCRCDVGWAGAACDGCAPAAYRNASGACVLPATGVSARVRAALRVGSSLGAALSDASPAGAAARAAFARDLRDDLRRALGLPPAVGGARRRLQTGSGGAPCANATLDVPPASVAVGAPVVGGGGSVGVTANVTLACAPSASGSGGGSFGALLGALTSLLAATAPGAPAPALAGAPSGSFLDGPATLDALAVDAAAGAAFAPLPDAAPPGAYAFAAELGAGVSLAWSASPSEDRVHVRMTCGARGAWCGVGVNDRPAMPGAVAVAVQPGQPPGAQLGGWALGGRDRGSVSALPPDSPSSPVDLARGTPATVTVAADGTTVATWAWPVGTAPGAVRLDAPVTLVVASGRPGAGVLGAHSDDTAAAASVHFGTGAVSRLAVGVKPGVVAHAVLMLLAWAALAPAGVAIARYGKGLGAAPAAAAAVPPAGAPGGAPPQPAAWFRAHWKLQVAGQLCSVVGVVIVLATRPAGSPHFATTHEGVGLAVFLVGLLQPALANAAVRPPKAPPSLARTVWEAAHKSLGYGALVAAVAAVFLGITQATAPTGHATALLTGLFAAYVAAAGAAVVALEVRRARAAPPVAPAAGVAAHGVKPAPHHHPGGGGGKARFTMGAMLAGPAVVAAASSGVDGGVVLGEPYDTQRRSVASWAGGGGGSSGGEEFSLRNPLAKATGGR